MDHFQSMAGKIFSEVTKGVEEFSISDKKYKRNKRKEGEKKTSSTDNFLFSSKKMDKNVLRRNSEPSCRTHGGFHHRKLD